MTEWWLLVGNIVASSSLGFCVTGKEGANLPYFQSGVVCDEEYLTSLNNFGGDDNAVVYDSDAPLNRIWDSEEKVDRESARNER